ncbi:MAG: rhodanese-like domain-containing protein [Candidatus Cloacimonetes bacterium]|nr:rhodanese-like domain-containing protein [Candidatus Cloacimonadota bacterium]
MKKHITIISVLALIFLITGCGTGFSTDGVFVDYKQLVSEAKSGITEIVYDEFKAKLEKGELRLVIDVREPSEFEAGFINQPDEEDEYPYPETFVVNIPRGLLEFKIGSKSYWDDDLFVEMPKKDEEIIVYCKKGGRSTLSAQSLMQLGYTNVKSLKGGYRIWLDPTAPLEETKKSSGGCG